MRFPLALPGVPADPDLQPGGNASLSLRLLDGDSEYGARKLIHLAHEIFPACLPGGNYYDQVDTFDLDPARLCSAFIWRKRMKFQFEMVCV